MNRKEDRVINQGFNYSNRKKRRMYKDSNTRELTMNDVSENKTRLQKIMEVNEANIEMGKKLDEYYLQNLISIDDEYTSSLNARCLKSLTEFYGDKSKAEKVHRKNLDIQKKINERE